MPRRCFTVQQLLYRRFVAVFKHQVETGLRETQEFPFMNAPLPPAGGEGRCNTSQVFGPKSERGQAFRDPQGASEEHQLFQMFPLGDTFAQLGDPPDPE